MIIRGLWARYVVGAVVGASTMALGPSSAVAQSPSGSIRKAVERAAPAVVTVRPIGLVETPIVELPPAVPFQVRALIPRRVRRPGPGDLDRVGSGVVVDALRGGVVTCDHILGGASQAVVILADGRERVSTAIRRDPETDLALVVIDPKDLNLTATTFADSPALAVGDWTIAIGRPAGEAATLSAGVFGTLREGASANRVDALLEADVRVQAVNRGGALVDLEGRLQGVLTDLVPSGIPGQGYAIPSDYVKRVVHDLGELGYVRRAYLGIQMGFMDPANGSSARRPGVLVQSVTNPGPAADAGLRPGDQITAIGDRPITSPGALRRRVEFAPIGEPLAISVVRGNERLELSIKPQELPRDPGAAGLAPTIGPAPVNRFRPLQGPAAEPAPSSRVQPEADTELDPIPDTRITPPRAAPPPLPR